MSGCESVATNAKQPKAILLKNNEDKKKIAAQETCTNPPALGWDGRTAVLPNHIIPYHGDASTLFQTTVLNAREAIALGIRTAPKRLTPLCSYLSTQTQTMKKDEPGRTS